MAHTGPSARNPFTDPKSLVECYGYTVPVANFPGGETGSFTEAPLESVVKYPAEGVNWNYTIQVVERPGYGCAHNVEFQRSGEQQGRGLCAMQSTGPCSRRTDPHAVVCPAGLRHFCGGSGCCKQWEVYVANKEKYREKAHLTTQVRASALTGTGPIPQLLAPQQRPSITAGLHLCFLPCALQAANHLRRALSKRGKINPWTSTSATLTPLNPTLSSQGSKTTTTASSSWCASARTLSW